MHVKATWLQDRGTQPLPSPTALLKGAYGSYCTALRRTLRLPLTRETHSAFCLDTAPPESCRASVLLNLRPPSPQELMLKGLDCSGASGAFATNQEVKKTPQCKKVAPPPPSPSS